MLSAVHRQIDEVKEILAARRLERAAIELKCDLAALRVQTAILRHTIVSRKAGFRHNQPRWPKRSPFGGGRWSGGAGTGGPSAGTNSGGRTPGGHHYVPGQLYRNEPLKPETRKVFEDGTTGPLRSKAHRYDEAHKNYNKGASEAFERFKAENGIGRSQDMTPDQAKRFLDEIKASTDPRIRSYNMRIYMQEFQFYLRRIPRRIE